MAVFTNDIDLEADYGITYNMGPLANGISTIGDEFTVGTDAARVTAAKAKYPYWIGYCTGIDPSLDPLKDRTATPGAPIWTNAQILACSSFVAAHNDAVWSTGGAIGANWYVGASPLSRCNIQWPHGSYYVNYPLIGNYGTYRGKGPGQSAPDLNIPANEVTFGTRISIHHETWLNITADDAGPKRHIFQSLNWTYEVGGVLYSGVMGSTGAPGALVRENYMEGLRVENVRLDGRKSMASFAVNGGNDYVSTYEDAGIAVWKPGSNSGFFNVKCDNFNNAGFLIAGSTPTELTNCRAFDCNQAGVWLRGDNTITITNFECDECPVTFLSTAYDDPSAAGFLLTPECTLTVNGVKVETGTSGVSSRYKGTMLLDGEGWIIAVINGVDYAGTNLYPELLCRIEPYPAGFTSTESYVEISGIKCFGFFRTLMHHVETGNHKKFFLDKGQYTLKYASTVHGFIYNSCDGATLVPKTGHTPPFLSIAYANRQEFLASPLVGTWTDSGVSGLPVFDNPVS